MSLSLYWIHVPSSCFWSRIGIYTIEHHASSYQRHPTRYNTQEPVGASGVMQNGTLWSFTIPRLKHVLIHWQTLNLYHTGPFVGVHIGAFSSYLKLIYLFHSPDLLLTFPAYIYFHCKVKYLISTFFWKICKLTLIVSVTMGIRNMPWNDWIKVILFFICYLFCYSYYNPFYSSTMDTNITTA